MSSSDTNTRAPVQPPAEVATAQPLAGHFGLVLPPLEPGQVLDGFRLEERLHQGGMAYL